MEESEELDIKPWKIVTNPYGEVYLRVNILDKWNRFSKDIDMYLDIHNLVKKRKMIPNRSDIIPMNGQVLLVKYVSHNTGLESTEYVVTIETSQPVRAD